MLWRRLLCIGEVFGKTSLKSKELQYYFRPKDLIHERNKMVQNMADIEPTQVKHLLGAPH
jgi:hypothetical protein